MLYDLLCIIPPQESKEKIFEIRDQILALIKKEQGEIIKEELLGKKRFFFPIKRFREGEYLSFKINALSEKIKNINKELNFNSLILRHLVVKIS